MTREEAIKALNEYGTLFPSDKIEAIDIAIEALKQVTGKLNNPDDSLLTADPEAYKEQKSKLDLISRQDAIETVRLESAKRLLLGRGDVLDILYALPSAGRLQTDIVRCSECEHKADNYCYKHSHEVTDSDFCSYGERSYRPYGT